MSNHNYLPKARWQAAAGVTCSAMFCSTLLTFSGPPQWWTTRGVIQDGADEDNYAAVNVGQAKWMATQAYLELSDQLAPFGGVDFTLEDIVPPVPDVTDEAWFKAQKAPLNIGQPLLGPLARVLQIPQHGTLIQRVEPSYKK